MLAQVSIYIQIHTHMHRCKQKYGVTERESDREREEDAAKLHASFVASLAARRLQLLVAFVSRLFT